MLFDIRGRRRTVIRFTYALLAAVLLLGLVGFGIGSDAPGGIFGSGHGGGGSGHGGGGGSSVDDQLDDLYDRVERNPRNASAWRALSLLQAGAAFEREGGHGGGERLVDDGPRRLVESTVAYEEYLKLVGERRVSAALAQTAARSYLLTRRLIDAVSAQRLAARDGGAASNFLLAQYAAAAGDLTLTERSLERALRAAPRDQRAVLRAQAPQLRRQAVLGPVPGRGHAGPPPGQ